MRYSHASLGRVLVLRLEDGDIVHECIEEAARAEGISHGAVLVLGGADEGSTLVVGPENGREAGIAPVKHLLDGVHEMAGVGTLFPGQDGRPVLHLHAAFGRGGAALAGCVRLGIRTWVVAEAVIIELIGSQARRCRDERTGFELLEV